MATPLTIAIPPLREGQAIAAWQSLFTAAVSALKDKVAIKLLPAYLKRGRLEEKGIPIDRGCRVQVVASVKGGAPDSPQGESDESEEGDYEAKGVQVVTAQHQKGKGYLRVGKKQALR